MFQNFFHNAPICKDAEAAPVTNENTILTNYRVQRTVVSADATDNWHINGVGLVS